MTSHILYERYYLYRQSLFSIATLSNVCTSANPFQHPKQPFHTHHHSRVTKFTPSAIWSFVFGHIIVRTPLVAPLVLARTLDPERTLPFHHMQHCTQHNFGYVVLYCTRSENLCLGQKDSYLVRKHKERGWAPCCI